MVVDDAARFRQILGCFPTGVTVVTALRDGRPVGLAAGSFFSVSLDPPLVGFCVMTTSNTWPVIERSGSFGVSILAHDQTGICRRLAGKGPDKFDRVPWSPAPVTGSLWVSETGLRSCCPRAFMDQSAKAVLLCDRRWRSSDGVRTSALGGPWPSDRWGRCPL